MSISVKLGPPMRTPDRFKRPIHVYPVGDLIEHNTEDELGLCLCCPRTEYLEGCPAIIIHTAADGRD